MTVSLRKLLVGAAVVLGVAVLVPLALAAERPDDRADRMSVTTSTGTEEFVPVGTADTVVARIDAGLTALGSEPTATRPDDRAGTIGIGSVVAVAPTEPVATTGTDLTDPSLVALVAGVIALLGVTAVFLVEHGRRGGGTGRRGTPGMPATTH